MHLAAGIDAVRFIVGAFGRLGMEVVGRKASSAEVVSVDTIAYREMRGRRLGGWARTNDHMSLPLHLGLRGIFDSMERCRGKGKAENSCIPLDAMQELQRIVSAHESVGRID